MAFITVEDLYGTVEIIAFDSVFNRVSNILVEDNVVLVEGRLSVREDDATKIVANNIKEFQTAKSKKILNIDITGIEEEKRLRLKGMLKFFSGDSNNIEVIVKEEQKEDIKVLMNISKEIYSELEFLLGKEKISLI